MKFTYRICAAVLSAVILLGSVCSCGVIPAINNNGNTSVDSGAVNSINVLDQVSTKTAPAPVIPNYSGRNTLNVAIDAEIATLSPFFAETDAELIAAGLAFTRLINIARGGVPIVQGMDGQKVEYLGTEYEYQGIADVKVTKNADGTADYAFTLREDAFFSDGTNITADDVIFSMYVLLDPSYRGYSDLGELPIVGLDEYRAGMMSLADRIYYTEGEEVSSVAASDVKRFRDTLAAVYGRYAEGVMRCVREEYSADTLRKYAGKWTDKVESENYLRAIAMVMLGYADWQKGDNGQYTGTLVTADGGEFGCIERFPSDSDLFSSAAKSTDTLLGIDSLCPEGKLEDVLREAFGDEYDTFFEVRRAFGSRTDSVSGIIKTGMYTFTVRLGRYDASDIYGFSFFVAPLHAYGSRDGYKYTENRFGFSKGDTVEIRNTATRVSSGAYFFKSERDGAYRFERNQLYYLGCPNVRYIDLIPAEEGEDVVAAIADGKYDLAARELDEQIMTRLDTVNRDGNKVSSVTYGNGGYGYIGINCDNVNIPEDETGEASASLRRALCVLLSLYSDIAAETFLPKGYTTADGPVVTGTYSLSSAESVHSLNVRDEDIYKDGMTVKQKKEIREQIETPEKAPAAETAVRIPAKPAAKAPAKKTVKIGK